MKKLNPSFSFLAILILFTTKSFSQATDSTSKFSFTGYVDAYYAVYTDSVGVGNYQKFASNDSRSRQFGLNVAAVTAQYDAEKVRGVVTLLYGDLPKSAWDSTFNNIMEAHVGVRLGKKVWLDGGFFRTHTGVEALFPKENFTTAISIHTVFEPYYEAGLRLNYKPTDKWDLYFLLVNGYNRFVDNNNKKSIGMLATYAVSDKLSMGYSNYLGDDTPLGDIISHFRNYENIFLNFQTGKLKAQLGFDFIRQQQYFLNVATGTLTYYSGVISFKYQAMHKFAIYTRGEIFNDADGLMAGEFTDAMGNLTGYKLFGETTGIEFKPTDNSYIRLEGRELVLDKDQQVFIWKGEVRNFRTEMLINMGITFGN